MPYIIVNGDVAKADAYRMLDNHERQLSSNVRRLEDPVTVRKKVIEVVLHFHLSIFLPMRILSQSILDADSPGPVLGAALHS